MSAKRIRLTEQTENDTIEAGVDIVHLKCDTTDKDDIESDSSKAIKSSFEALSSEDTNPLDKAFIGPTCDDIIESPNNSDLEVLKAADATGLWIPVGCILARENMF